MQMHSHSMQIELLELGTYLGPGTMDQLTLPSKSREMLEMLESLGSPLSLSTEASPAPFSRSNSTRTHRTSLLTVATLFSACT